MKRKLISNSLNKSLPLLRVITKLPSNSRRRILKEVGDEKVVYNALHELAHNTLNGKIPLNIVQKRKLKPHKNTLENLCDAKYGKCSKKRKHLIQQSGGFLPIVLQALIPIIGGLLANKLTK